MEARPARTKHHDDEHHDDKHHEDEHFRDEHHNDSFRDLCMLYADFNRPVFLEQILRFVASYGASKAELSAIRAAVQRWALRLRQRGISVMFVHHAGKGGAQRGTSRREDLLDVVINLRHPADYNPAEGLRCEVHYEKCRGFYGADAKPFEVKMEQGQGGEAVWTKRDLENVLEVRAAELFEDGVRRSATWQNNSVFRSRGLV